MTKMKLAQKAWVTGTCSLIGFLTISPQIFIVWPWFGRELSVELFEILALLNFLAFMVFYNYYLCVTTPAGSVPPDWTPDSNALQTFEVKRATLRPRYCKTCLGPKPPRTHHCRQCGGCVLKMDHHCPWIANCVGFRNQGHFLRFLIWVDIAVIAMTTVLGFRVKAFSAWTSPDPTTTDILFLVFNLSGLIPVLVCVGIFSIYHMYCAAGNSTTIEGWEKDRVATLVRRGKVKEIKYPYDIGLYRNIQAVLGPNPFLWLWPQPMRGDGLSFSVSASAGDSSQQYAWPPRDPADSQPRRTLPLDRSPFTYGEEGLNPDLHPTNDPSRDEEMPEEEYSSGDDRQSISRSSSPEAYLSDYDEDDVPLEELRKRVKVRRGSDGEYQVRTTRRDWDWDIQDEDGAVVPVDSDGVPFRGRPQDQPGRYHIYDQHHE